MGLLDGLREVLGMRAEADAGRDADPEDLFGMSTAYVTMEADLGYEPVGEAALCFSEVDSTGFQNAVEEVHAILEAGEEETGTKTHTHQDSHGYSWVVLEDDDFEDLVTSLHFAADTFVEEGYGSRLLAVLFAFRKRGGSKGRRKGDDYVYWIYSFRRGAYYPFAPQAGNERDEAAEFKLESNLDGELELEQDKEYWYPLWPDRAGTHPWE
ncbi:hypothetical protein DMJ13_02355 [halophilic archaeon]|nr:hypothetical protein DMJ13_02355 [halophilic archaeon]